MPGFSQPTTGMTEWYNHPAYNRYWTHYSRVQDWLKQCRRSQELANFRAVQDMNCGYYGQPIYQPPDSFAGAHPCFLYHQPALPAPQEGYFVGENPVDYGHVFAAQESNVNELEHEEGEDESEEGSGSEFEMVVSEEWIALMKHSEEFRRQRDAHKEAEDRLREKVEFVELGSFQKSNRKTIGHHTKEEKAAREKKMELLYGSRAPHIRSMEIAMQLTFDRYYDLKKPTLWPVIPLKL